jgi:hypothetical protein
MFAALDYDLLIRGPITSGASIDVFDNDALKMADDNGGQGKSAGLGFFEKSFYLVRKDKDISRLKQVFFFR